MKTMALVESQDLGEKMLSLSLRAEGIERLPDDSAPNRLLWEKILRFSGNRSRADLLTDIGLGKRIASMMAKRIVVLLAEKGEKPDALLLSRVLDSAPGWAVRAVESAWLRLQRTSVRGGGEGSRRR